MFHIVAPASAAEKTTRHGSRSRQDGWKRIRDTAAMARVVLRCEKQEQKPFLGAL
jgi:hypothetical protein